MSMKVLVIGAAGATGSRVVQDLTQRGYTVRAMVRRPDQAQTLRDQGVETVVGDVNRPETLGPALAGCQGVVNAAGGRPSWDFSVFYRVDYEGLKNLVKAAQAAGIEHFVLVSSLCVSRFFHQLNLFGLVLYWKHQGEKFLQASGLSYTIVRPGGLKNVDNQDGVILGAADTLFSGSIPRSRVAQVCGEALTSPHAKNKIVEVVGDPLQTLPDSAEQWDRLFAQV